MRKKGHAAKENRRLCEQIFGSMVNMVIRETGDRIITVIIAILEPDVETRIHSGFLGSFCEVLREELALFVEVVSSTLVVVVNRYALQL